MGELHDAKLLETLEAKEEEVVPDEMTAKMYKETFELYQALSKPIKKMHEIREIYRLK